jgi:hypothetical protein
VFVDDFRSRVGAEIDRRKSSLGEAYPFSVSADGEELSFSGDLNYGQVAYLLSILIQNSWTDGLLSAPHKLSEPEFVSARSSFEIVAAFAAAGYAEGPSFHVGRNRGGAEKLLEYLRTAWEKIQDGSVRHSPVHDAPEHANDDGVDAISVRRSQSGLPHKGIVFVQSAAGQDWKSKSIKVIVDRFLRNWFDVTPVSPREYLMVIADLPERPTVFQRTQELGFIAHRLEAPAYALLAEKLLNQGKLHLDCVDYRTRPNKWIDQYFSDRGVAF